MPETMRIPQAVKDKCRITRHLGDFLVVYPRTYGLIDRGFPILGTYYQSWCAALREAVRARDAFLNGESPVPPVMRVR